MGVGLDCPRTPSFRLEGRTALVTGATSGLGLGAAVALAEAGAEVTLLARNVDKLATTERLFQREGWPVQTVACDMSDLGALSHFWDGVAGFDIVVNSAGMARHGPALDTRTEDYDAVMNLNVRSSFFLAQAAAEKMIVRGRGGSIIFISSQMAHTGGIDRAVYCGSKHALEGFQKAMAVEWGQHGIRVNSICPTFIRTPLTQATFDNPERKAWMTEKIKLGRVGEVTDIMGAVVFLASAASALMTGTSLLIDGGWTAG